MFVVSDLAVGDLSVIPRAWRMLSHPELPSCRSAQLCLPKPWPTKALPDVSRGPGVRAGDLSAAAQGAGGDPSPHGRALPERSRRCPFCPRRALSTRHPEGGHHQLRPLKPHELVSLVVQNHNLGFWTTRASMVVYICSASRKKKEKVF